MLCWLVYGLFLEVTKKKHQFVESLVFFLHKRLESSLHAGLLVVSWEIKQFYQTRHDQKAHSFALFLKIVFCSVVLCMSYDVFQGSFGAPCVWGFVWDATCYKAVVKLCPDSILCCEFSSHFLVQNFRGMS